jgi:hypothetical protein
MQLQDSNAYGELSLSRLEEFEKAILSKLPAEYRAYLVAHNGGKPRKPFFKIPDNISRIHGSFYGLHEGPKYSQLDLVNQNLKGRLPLSALAIASDAFGNQICIALSKEQFGKIFFWEHDLENHPENYPKILAPSFPAFIDSLIEWEAPNRTEMDRVIKENDLKALIKILDSGYDIEKEQAEGRTILEIAAIQNRPEIIELLLKQGAKIRNSLSLAEKNAKYFPDHKPIVELLRAFIKNENKSSE